MLLNLTLLPTEGAMKRCQVGAGDVLSARQKVEAVNF